MDNPSNDWRLDPAALTGVVAGITALAVFAAAGVSQLHPEAAQWLTSGTVSNLSVKQLMQTGAITTASPGFELYAGLLHRILGGGALYAHYVLALIFGALTVGLVSHLATDVSGRPLGGALAGLAMVSMPPVVTAFTAIGPAAPAYALGTIVLVGLTRRQPRWWTQLATLIAGAGWTLVWPPAFGLLALGWLWRVTDRRGGSPPNDEPDEATTDETDADGLFAQPALPIGLALAPVAVILLVSLHPGFWSAPVGRWGAFLYELVSPQSDSVVYAATAYTEGRPPLWIGLQLAVESLPLPTVILGFVGCVVFWRGGDHERATARESGRLTRTLAGTAVLLALMPWITRALSFGAVDHLGYLAISIAPLAGATAATLGIDLADGIADVEPVNARRIGALAGALVLLPGALSVVAAHPVADCWWNSLVDGPRGAAETGRPVCRHGGLPVSLVGDLDGQSIYGGEARDALEAYRRAGWLADELTVQNAAADATAIVRRAETMRPGTKSVGDNPNALVAPAAHRLRTIEIDDLPVWRVDRLPQQIPDDFIESSSSSE